MSAAYAAVDGSVAALFASPGLLAVLGCLTFFLFEYCWHELVHTYTYDLFRERLGFKLVWGCTCFVRRGALGGGTLLLVKFRLACSIPFSMVSEYSRLHSHRVV